IEAARAGEQGKGFSVVAEEVRKLAERSSTATKEIAGLISNIQQTLTEAVDAMNESSLEVENGVFHANEAGSALTTIIKAVETVYEQAQETAALSETTLAAANQMVSSVESVSAVVEENTAATQEMTTRASELSDAIDSIASVSEENNAAVEEVSASAEEMSNDIEEVALAAQKLAGMADKLQSLVMKFKL
ncbi:MAG: methyl-accepting chemotaxis protein, partial [Anaerolineae bacterium]|nr:methyl-accepting chemotaxis protein [Anaerolineae bacterium]